MSKKPKLPKDKWKSDVKRCALPISSSLTKQQCGAGTANRPQNNETEHRAERQFSHGTEVERG